MTKFTANYLDKARSNNLKNYLADHIEEFKSLTKFAKYLGLYASNLSPILNGEKRFTDRLAETIENKLNLPRGFLSGLSKPNSILVPFKDRDKNNVLVDYGEVLELNRIFINPEHQDINTLFAIKPNISIGRNSMNKSVSAQKILIFDGADIELFNKKIYLILFYGNLLLRRCSLDSKSAIFESDQPEIYSKIIYGSEDVIILGRLLYSAFLESY